MVEVVEADGGGRGPYEQRCTPANRRTSLMYRYTTADQTAVNPGKRG